MEKKKNKFVRYIIVDVNIDIRRGDRQGKEEEEVGEGKEKGQEAGTRNPEPEAR